MIVNRKIYNKIGLLLLFRIRVEFITVILPQLKEGLRHRM